MRFLLLLASFLVIVVSALVACAPGPAPTPTKTIDLAAIQVAYKSGSHSNDYGESRGPNTYCARCHSPRNWDPAAVVDAPPNCVSCKFPFDKQVRLAKGNTFIEARSWKNIGCDVCHQVDANGVVDPKPVIWNQATGHYDAVRDNTELCEKCHADSLGGTDHKIIVGGSAHTTEIGLLANGPQQCTDCHDPHSQKADCESCHKDARHPATPIAGHDAAHAKVACDACHDASGLSLGPTQDFSQWVAFQMVTSHEGGPPTRTQVTSHVLQKAVDCTRCHFDNNPWNLRSLVTPTPVASPAAGGRPAAAATPTAAK
jgi:hypothetical protein